MRGQPVLVQQLQDIVDDRVLGFRQQVRLRKGGLRDRRTGILAAEFGDDVVEVLLRAEALAFQYLHKRGDLPLIGDGDVLHGHDLVLGHNVP